MDVSVEPLSRQKLSQLLPEDQFLVSFPRSGSTWVRLTLRDIVVSDAQRNSAPTPRELFPDLHLNTGDAPVYSTLGFRSRVFKSHNLRDLRHRKMVYLIRQPADTLVSYYHFHRMFDHLKPLTEDGLVKFCESMLPNWCAHVETALAQRRARPEGVRFLCYERLHADPLNEMRGVLGFFGLSASDEAVTAGVQANSFERLRSREEKQGKPENDRFFRKGRIGGAAEELEPAVLDAIEKRGGSLYRRVREVEEMERKEASSRNACTALFRGDAVTEAFAGLAPTRHFGRP